MPTVLKLQEGTLFVVSGRKYETFVDIIFYYKIVLSND